MAMNDRGASSLAEVLLRRRAITLETLNEARSEAEAANIRLEQLLINKKTISGDEMSLSISDYLDMPPISLAHFTLSPNLLELISDKWLKQLQVVPVAKIGHSLSVAMADPFNINGIDMLHSLTNLEIHPMVAQEHEVKAILDNLAQEASTGLEDILRDVEDGEDVEFGMDQGDDVSLDEIMEIAEEAPVIRIVNSIMVEALRHKSSDIHIEPMEKSLRLRYRTDGILVENPSPPKRLHPAIISRIKIMSNLDIAERRVPQDGRFKIKALGKEADVRVSILPTVHGEKIVMRLLDKANLKPGLDALGLDPRALDNFKYAIGQPYGMILVTGPTGSGKTTTLYSCLQDLNTIDVNISTVEDPVEYQLPGVNQVQVHSNVGMTFSAALRSLLRQDPDIVMVGEIRDGETAEIAVKAALTGHLVLSTLHTNDAAGAVARLNNMGVEQFLLASSLIMTQAQRLFRKVCTACRREIEMPQELLRVNQMDPDEFADIQFYEAVGCPKCSNIGYKGRASLMEILLVDDFIRATIAKDCNANSIKKMAIDNGMLTLRDLGYQRVKEGVSTLEEILRVTSGG